MLPASESSAGAGGRTRSCSAAASAVTRPWQLALNRSGPHALALVEGRLDLDRDEIVPPARADEKCDHSCVGRLSKAFLSPLRQLGTCHANLRLRLQQMRLRVRDAGPLVRDPLVPILRKHRPNAPAFVDRRAL